MSDNTKYESYRAEVREKTFSAFEKLVTVDTFAQNEAITSITKNIKITPASSMAYYRQAYNAHVLFHKYRLEKASFVCCTFRAVYKNSKHEDIQTMYGFLYSTIDEGIVENRYVSVCPTYTSQDGEYRDRFLPFVYFMSLREKYQRQFDIAEELVLRYMAAGSLTFDVNVFGPEAHADQASLMTKNVDDLRLAITFFAYAWLVDFHRIHTNVMERHIVEAYRKVIYHKRDIPTYEALSESLVDINDMVRNLIELVIPSMVVNESKIPSLRTGQKIFQTTIREITEINNISLETWRELYMSYKCADLVLSMICPSFPLFNRWFYIQHSNPNGLFDNPTQFTKYDNNLIARRIHKNIRVAENRTYNFGVITGKKVHINQMFQTLSNKIQDSMRFAERHLILTNVAICAHSEFVGRTVRNLPAIATNADAQYRFGTTDMFFSLESMHKHVFEWLYAFFCINTKVGIVHADIHANNVTVQPMRSMSTAGVKNPAVMYLLDRRNQKESNAYAFRSNGATSMVIDFSRSIIGNMTALQREFSHDYAREFSLSQETRVYRSIYRVIPDFADGNEADLKKLISGNFPVCFKIMTGLDSIMLARTLLNVISSEAELEVPADIVEFLQTLEQRARQLVIDNFFSAIKYTNITKDNVPWVNQRLISEMFADYRIEESNVDKFTDYTIVDVHNYNNNVVANSREYNGLPAHVRTDISMDLLKKYDIPYDQDSIEWLNFKRKDESHGVEDVMSRYAVIDHWSVDE